ncbi:unnamed protein product [Didymodactylos carnosus]|uniref:Uncharacterized protein n=1 Tax=Didymodactylos carnosus TaxID=1234261 RepID=A0A814R9C3_9BILA|nr:unnamed protein product [Didymodactylos carnosus]CAF3894597.1 unnamed protein product [Didymodactylos carnosus]
MREVLDCLKDLNENYKDIKIIDIDDNYLKPAIMSQIHSVETTEDHRNTEDPKNATYIFFLQYLNDLKKAYSGICIALRQQFPGKQRVTAGQVTNDDSFKGLIRSDMVFRPDPKKEWYMTVF